MMAGLRNIAGIAVRHSWLWWLGVLIWGAILFILSSDTAPPSGPDFPFKDKVLHCTWFGAGSACFLIALFGKKWRATTVAGAPSPSAGLSLLRLLLVGFLFTALVGASDEYHQTFTPGRMGNDPWDWLADVTGGVLGAAVAWRMIKWARG